MNQFEKFLIIMFGEMYLFLRFKRHISWVSELLKLSRYLATELHLSSKFFFHNMETIVMELLKNRN